MFLIFGAAFVFFLAFLSFFSFLLLYYVILVLADIKTHAPDFSENGDHNISHLTRMDLSEAFTPVMATMPDALLPNSSLDNVSQASSGSSRSPPLPPHSQVASICIVLVVSVIILGTVVGNVLVVVAVFTSRALRAPQNLFLVSLASADILVATLVIPFSLANEVRELLFRLLCSLVLSTVSFLMHSVPGAYLLK